MDERPFAEGLNNLKRSPLFSFSLGSKELFHSNFLYWFGGIYPNEMGIAFSEFISDRSGDCALKDFPKREKENIDVWFRFKNGSELIVENKVKSIPNREQLQRYTKEQLNIESADRKNFLLLSLTKPSFVTDKFFQINNTKWHFLDYAGLSILLGNLVDKIDDPYHRAILQDYVQFAADLQRISELANIDLTSDTFNFNNDEAAKELRSIRMADFYLKKKFAFIAEELAKRLEMIFPDRIKRDDWNVARRGRNDAVGTIFVNYGMTRAQGLVEMMCVVRTGLCLGVQIQESSYRKFVLGDRNGIIAQKLKNDNLWFDFPSIFEIKTIYPDKEGKNFNSYNGEFYYRYVRIPMTLKISEVIDCMVKDARMIFEKLIAWLKMQE